MKTCQACGRPILLMCQKNTPYCCALCEDKGEGIEVNGFDPAEWCTECHHLWEHHGEHGCYRNDPGAGWACSCVLTPPAEQQDGA